MPRRFNPGSLLAALFVVSALLVQFIPIQAAADEKAMDPATLITILEPLRLAVGEFRKSNNAWPTQEWSQTELKKALEQGKLDPETLLIEDFWTDETTFFMNLLEPESGKNLVMTGHPDGITLESR